jgi:cytochrome c oxidase assembly protein subunit 15
MTKSRPLALFRHAARVAAVLAAIVVVVGAWVRLTDAGLGCPDWPGCYGHVHPAGVAEHLPAATAAYPSSPFDYQKALHEMVHRYIASTLGLLIIGLCVLAVRNRREPGQPRILPFALLTIVCLQGALGAFTVTLLLKPLIVTLHLVGGLTTLSILWWLSLEPRHTALTMAERPVRALALLGGVIIAGQILLGGWTSTNYAATACPDFPLCQGSAAPPMDFARGFSVTHKLGLDNNGAPLELSARTAIHYTHRLGAVIVALLITSLVVLAYRRSQNPCTRLASLAVAAALIVQLLIGMNLVLQGFPLWLGTLHNAGAAFLLLSILSLVHSLHSRRTA